MRSLSALSDSALEYAYYVGADQHIHTLVGIMMSVSNNISSWTDYDVTAEGLSPLAASDSGISGLGDKDGNYVFYTDADQHVFQFSDSTTRASQDLSAATGGPLAALGSGISSFADSEGEHVFYVAADQHIHQLWYNTSTWADYDLTAGTGGPLAASGSGISSFADSFGEHALYIGVDHHLHQLYFAYGKWSDSDLTTWGKGPQVAAGSSLSSFADSFGEHAFYIGVDQHVHQLYFASGNWSDSDLTTWGKGPQVAAGSSLSGFADSDGEHLFYIGNDQHIHQLWFNTSTWVDYDLTAATGGPLAAAASGISSFADNQGEHVFYVGADQHIHQLWYVNYNWVDQDLTWIASRSRGPLQVTPLFWAGAPEPCCLGAPNPQVGALPSHSAQLDVLTTDYQLPPQDMITTWLAGFGRVNDVVLRFYAQKQDAKQILTAAVMVALNMPIMIDMLISIIVDPKYCVILSQIAVTGRTAFASFLAWQPKDSDLVQQVMASNPTVQFNPASLQAAATKVLDLAYGAVWAIRANDATWRSARFNFGWIAVSGEDDLPHRPVNVPSAPYPQYDLDVVIPGAGETSITIRTRYMVARSGDRLVPPPDCSMPVQLTPQNPPSYSGRDLPLTDPPVISSTDQILIYLHGGSSRLEEAVRFADELLAEGNKQGRSYTVIAMDLVNSGYSSPVEHTRIAPGGASYRPSGGDPTAVIPPWPALTYGYPIMDTEEQFILNFIDALDAKVGNIKGRIAAIMGGSLGGNMAIRLARRANVSPFLNTIIAWSVTCMRGPVDTFTYECIKGTVAGCGADMVNKFMADETPNSRTGFFVDLYQEPVAECAGITLIPAQPPMWYGDSWSCKKQGIALSEFDRFEYYTPEYRRWTIRLNFEMAVYSFQEGDLFVSPGNNHPRGPARYLSVNSQLFLAAGQEDNYPNVSIFDNTTSVAGQMVNTPGTTLFLAWTGHSIYEERPSLFAQRVVAFLQSVTR